MPISGGGGGASSGSAEFDFSGGAAHVTASAASGGGTVSESVASWFDLGTVHRLVVTAASNTVLTTFEVFAEAAETTLLYQAVGIDAFSADYEDLVPWHYRDNDAGTELHIKLTNNGANNSTYTITVQGIGT